MYVRGDPDPGPAIRGIRRVFRTLDPSAAITEVSALEQEVQNSLWQERLVSILSGAFSLIAAVLAALGIYGALTFSIGRHFHDLGIRMAVGAGPRAIVASAGGRIGMAVGLGIAGGWVASRLLLSLTQPLRLASGTVDGGSFAIANGVTLICVVAAAAGPLWRVSRMDATDALRQGG